MTLWNLEKWYIREPISKAGIDVERAFVPRGRRGGWDKLGEQH